MMKIGTTHSICKHFIEEYGSKEEVNMMGRNFFVGSGGSVAGSVQRAWAQCFPDEPLPKVKDMMLAKTAWAGNGIKPAEAKKQARDAREMTAALWYEFYEGFKGAIPGWRPPKPCKEYENFMARKRPGGARVGDFDDQLSVCAEILKRDSRVVKAIQSAYAHILVDESQDLNSVQQSLFDLMSGHITDGSDGKSFWQIGDDKQCISIDTVISLPKGTLKVAKELHVGDTVLAYRNGVVCPQIIHHIMPSTWTYGYRITTVSGCSLTVSPNHQIWAKAKLFQDIARAVRLVAHGAKGTVVQMAWVGASLDSVLANLGIAFRTNKKSERRSIRKVFVSYRKALSFAQTLAIAAGSVVQEYLDICDDLLELLSTDDLTIGMSVPVQFGPSIVLEQIATIEKIDGEFLDLDIDDASNFFGGGILSHNSIYSFRGAKPEQFIALKDNPGWKTRIIRTNYRSAPEIVTTANKLIAHNGNQIPMEANPDPRKAKGAASIRVTKPVDDAAAAVTTVREIKDAMADGSSVSDFAVLTRTNKELHAFETACIIKGVPYARKGASSFFGSPETTAVLGYVQLATGDDAQKMQQALKQVINKPNRFFVSPEAGTAAVEMALSAYAHRSGTDIKVLNPLTALGDRRFQETLAQKLTGQTYGFKYNKTVEKLAEMGRELNSMRSNAGDPSYKMKDMFSDILNLKGIAGSTDSSGKTTWGDQTFRESLQVDLKNAIGDEDDTEEDDDENVETMGLGNVGFLFELAKADPDDQDDTLNDPSTPMGFKAKMERYASRMRDLRVDITKWNKEQEALPPEQRKPPPGVYLGTSHSTKGSQWVNVYVSMPKGKFPFERKPKPGEHEPSPEEEQARIEQERRLAYVAITRPIKNLTIICPSVVGGKPGGVSQFVDEAGLAVGENVAKPNSGVVSKEASVAHWHLPRGVASVPEYGRK